MPWREPATGRWLARTLCWAAAVCVVLYGAAYLSGRALAPTRQIGKTQVCVSNVRLLARAFALYADDHEDRYPPSVVWMDATGPYVVQERRFRCPAVEVEGAAAFGYAASAALDGSARADLDMPGETPLVYDSTLLGRNAADDGGSLPMPGRHVRRLARDGPWEPANVVAYADGRARLEWRR